MAAELSSITFGSRGVYSGGPEEMEWVSVGPLHSHILDMAEAVPAEEAVEVGRQEGVVWVEEEDGRGSVRGGTSRGGTSVLFRPFPL